MTPNPHLPTTSTAVRAPHLRIPGVGVEELWLAPDAATLAARTGADSTGSRSLLFLDTITGEERGAIVLNADEAAVLAGNWSAAMSYDRWTGEITVRRAVTCEIVGRLNPHRDRTVHALAIADRGTVAASIGAESGVVLWRPADGAVLAAFTPAAVDLDSCALTFSPDGRYLAVRTDPDTVELWSTSPLQLAVSLPETGPPVFSGDGRWLAIAGEAIRLYDLHRNTATETLPGQYPLAFTHDGVLLVAGAPDGSTEIWRTDPPRPFAHLRGGNARLSPDGRVLVVSGVPSELVLVQTGGRTLARLTGIRGEVQAVAVGPDGAVVVAACSDGAIRVWRAGTA